jgi:hypothetical protein
MADALARLALVTVQVIEAPVANSDALEGIM